MDIKELQKSIHNNAILHGWYHDEKKFYDIIALIHSEWSEALEEVRINKIDTYYEGDKPCGYWVELADGIIRLYDISQYWQFEAKEISFDAVDTTSIDKFSLSEFVGYLHTLTDWLQDRVLFFPDIIINNIFYHAHNHKVDLWAVIKEKHEYNKKRSYRHGGKKL